VDPESGRQNVSAYGLGTMGYTTLNIDRTGIEGSPARLVARSVTGQVTPGRKRSVTFQSP